MVPFQKGAWLRLYDIPLHVWNVSFFFKLCVFYCGSYLRTASCSLEKEQFDYVRVLVATSSLDIIFVVDKLLIDDPSKRKLLIDNVLTEVKIVEEWGFSIGEDACLFEEGDGQNNQKDSEDIHVDLDMCNNVDT